MFIELFERHSARDSRVIDMSTWKESYKKWKAKEISNEEFARVSSIKNFNYLEPAISDLWSAGTQESFNDAYNKIGQAYKLN